MTPEITSAIDGALIEVRFALAPATVRDQFAAIIMELGRYMAIAGGGWPPEQRKEWINAVKAELEEFPVVMVLESIARARRRVRFPSEFVPWVVADIEPAVDKLKVEERRLSDLREIARA